MPDYQPPTGRKYGLSENRFRRLALRGLEIHVHVHTDKPKPEGEQVDRSSTPWRRHGGLGGGFGGGGVG